MVFPSCRLRRRLVGARHPPWVSGSPESGPPQQRRWFLTGPVELRPGEPRPHHEQQDADHDADAVVRDRRCWAHRLRHQRIRYGMPRAAVGVRLPLASRVADHSVLPPSPAGFHSCGLRAANWPGVRPTDPAAAYRFAPCPTDSVPLGWTNGWSVARVPGGLSRPDPAGWSDTGVVAGPAGPGGPA